MCARGGGGGGGGKQDLEPGTPPQSLARFVFLHFLSAVGTKEGAAAQCRNLLQCVVHWRGSLPEVRVQRAACSQAACVCDMCGGCATACVTACVGANPWVV
jgi:hypothetical protein